MLKKLFRYLKNCVTVHKFGEYGTGAYVSKTTRISYGQHINIADDVWIGPDCDLDGAGGISIQKGSILAPEVVIYSRNHNYDSPDLSALPYDNIVILKEVVIGKYVWIGRRAIILPGVHIGSHAVVAAGSVVTKNVPDYALVAGNPARVVKFRNQELINKLEAGGCFVYSKYGHKKVFQRHGK